MDKAKVKEIVGKAKVIGRPTWTPEVIRALAKQVPDFVWRAYRPTKEGHR